MTLFETLSPEEQSQIDRLCGQWELLLTTESQPSLDNLLLQIRQPVPRRALLVELLLTQLDHLAQHSSLVEETIPEPSDFLLPFLDRAYQAHPELSQHHDVFTPLVARAFHWSQHQQPHPRVSGYVARFNSLQGVELAIRRGLAEDWPVYLHIEHRDLSFQMPIVYPVVVGRQREADSRPISVVDLAGQEHQVFVAPRSERRVSRKHLRFEVVSRYRIQVTNTSQRSEALIDNDEKLHGGETIARNCPVKIRIFGCELCLDKI